MAESYTDTILLEANRKSSPEFLAGNLDSKNSWTNDLGAGVKLDIGDTISVHSAYISEIGNEDATIEIKGRKAINNIGQVQKYTTENVSLNKVIGEENNGDPLYKLNKKDGNYSYEYTIDDPVEHIITDNEINMTHSYYKCAQGDNYISLPRRCATDDIQGWFEQGKNWARYNSEANGRVHSQNPFRLSTDYSEARYYGQSNGYGYNTTETDHGGKRVEISNDGTRFTLFVRKSFKNYVPKGEKTGFYLQGERDPAMMDFIWYKRTVKYSINEGFNSPSNVADQFTNQMNDVVKLTNVSYGNEAGEDGTTDLENDGQIKQNNLNLQAESNTFSIFPCATAWFINSAEKLWSDDSYDDNIELPFVVNALTNNIVPLSHFPYQNQFQLWMNFPGQNKNEMFKDRTVVPGYKFKGIKDQTDNIEFRLLPLYGQYFAKIVGANVITVRDLVSSSAAPADNVAASFFSIDKEIGGGLPNVGLVVGNSKYVYQLSNENMPINFESSYSTVGFKRPEIQEYGRKLMADGRDDRETIDGSFSTNVMRYPMTDPQPNGPSQTILTKMEWNDTNLTNLKNLFEAQALYPELFDYNAFNASQQELVTTADPALIIARKNASDAVDAAQAAYDADPTNENLEALVAAKLALVAAQAAEDASEDNGKNITVDTARFLHMNNNEDASHTVSKQFKSWNATSMGGYIVLDSVTNLFRGSRLYSSQPDTDESRVFPSDTYITKIVSASNAVYVSNDINASNLPEVDEYLYFTSNGLGNDRYTNATDRAEYNHNAGAVFFDYNPARKDKTDKFGDESDVYNSLYYGFGVKYTIANVDYIGFSIRKTQRGTLLRDTWCNDQFPHGYSIVDRDIGFDKHFNAFGTAAILMYNGHSSLWGGEYSASDIEGSPFSTSGFTGSQAGIRENLPTVGPIYRSYMRQPQWNGWFIAGTRKYGALCGNPEAELLHNEIYCGANQPSLQFDSTASRFSFVNLHTPELIGANSDSVKDSATSELSAKICYKINKRLSRMNFSPNFTPYNNVFKCVSSGQEGNLKPEKDNNITPFTIMDAQSGIFIEDYGCDEANWSQSLWELLGFTYKQFHNVGSRLARFNDTGLTTSTPTTNALVRTEDLQTYLVAGKDSIPIFNSLEVAYPHWRYDIENGSGSAHWNIESDRYSLAFPGYLQYPEVVQVEPTSTTIVADNLPRKMLSPIYLIKSDLLNPMYLGGREGNTALPIIGIVDKTAGYGDFYSGARDATIFTNTIPRTIQNIKTSIVDADGSASRVDDSSCVIYKVTKNIRSNRSVLDNILNPPQ